MITRTLYFTTPGLLHLDNTLISFRGKDEEEEKTIPPEDVGVLILEHQGIIVTEALLTACAEWNIACVVCDGRHLPSGLLLPLEGHDTQSERYRAQISVRKPVLKNLWMQTVKAKVLNQAAVLRESGQEAGHLERLAVRVRSGDVSNIEAQAATWYWKRLFRKVGIEDFSRDREGLSPNNALNYGYSILRAVVARALVGSGLLPTLGIHHHNRYNAYCLADDIMEPYRPWVDAEVIAIIKDEGIPWDLSREQRCRLISLPNTDVLVDGEKSPLMVAVQRTAFSLVKCYNGESRTLLYPRRE